MFVLAKIYDIVFTMTPFVCYIKLFNQVNTELLAQDNRIKNQLSLVYNTGLPAVPLGEEQLDYKKI